MDRTLARLAQMRIWEALPGAVTRAFQIQARAEQIRTSELTVAEKRAQLAALDLQFKVLKETILDRTVPTLQRIDMQTLMASVPMASAEVDAERAADPLAAERRAMREALRALCHGRAVPPELTLLPASDDG